MADQKVRRQQALVTGATGFVGSNLVRSLLNKGWKVDVIVRPSSSLDMLEEGNNKLFIHVFNGGMKQMSEIVSKASPDVVFLIASMMVGEHESEQVEGLISSNITFGCQLLEAMNINGVSKFVNTGTYWEHYENKQYSPVNLYAATKFAFQNILQYYIEAKGINAVTLKLFDSYGPYDPRPKLLNLLIRIVETGDALAMSPGEQKIDLVHINDLVNAYIVAAKRLTDGMVKEHEVYGVATGNTITLKELIVLFEKKTNQKINIEWGGSSYKNREVMTPFDGYKIMPGWSAEISLETGLDSMLS